MRKEHRQKSVLDACNLLAIRWWCIKNRHDYVMEITAWAQEHFEKSTKSLCHLQMQHDSEMPLSFWAKATLKWTEGKLKTLKR